MTDVFVSYSRKDAVFARRLVQALKDAGHDSWVDWSSIPYSVDWWEEICQGIEAADNFVLIVTPDSLSSKICNQEIEHALKHKKRVIPVVHRDVMVQGKPLPEIVQGWFGEAWRLTAEDNWTQLSHLNWLFFRETDVFEESFAKLISTSEQDPEYVKQHTRLLLWAREWERSERSPSSLLRGDELVEAEDWLASAQNNDPCPTALHREYITQSRRVEDSLRQQEIRREQLVRRLRTAAVIAGLVGVLALAATAFAVSQTNNAIELGATAQAGATQVAADAAYFALQQERVATLAAGAVVVPPGSTTPEPTQFVATLTQIAVLNDWVPVEMTDEFGVVMVQVPAGCFYMGSVAGPDELPVYLQCFDEPFWIDKFEVTNAQYAQVAGEVPPSEFTNDLNPVDSITWFDARDFCALRAARLPTEREWEYAARGPDGLTYPWGNALIKDAAVYLLPPRMGPMPVMDSFGQTMRPLDKSWVGAIDMAGNVWEWTSTRYDDLDGSRQLNDLMGHYPYPYVADDGREEDETLEEFESRFPIFTVRVVRGGTFDRTAIGLRGAIRHWDYPDGERSETGFRCTLTEEISQSM